MLRGIGDDVRSLAFLKLSVSIRGHPWLQIITHPYLHCFFDQALGGSPFGLRQAARHAPRYVGVDVRRLTFPKVFVSISWFRQAVLPRFLPFGYVPVHVLAARTFFHSSDIERVAST